MGLILVLSAVGLGVAYYSGSLEKFIRGLGAQAQGSGNVVSFRRGSGGRTPEQIARRQEVIGMAGGR